MNNQMKDWNNQMKENNNKIKKSLNWLGIIVIGSIIVSLAFICLFGYIVFHFISKWW
jgi:hypothetical protein